MATYVVLGNFTDQGIRAAKELTEAGGGFQENGRDLRDHRKGTVLDAGTL